MSALLTSRDALAKALDLSPLRCTCGAEAHDFCGQCIADALLASGAVIDAARLADNMRLVAIVQTETGCLFAPASRATHSIAAALTERSAL